jgi:hypothetical protein
MASFTGSHVPSPALAGEGQGGGGPGERAAFVAAPTPALPRNGGRGSYGVLGFWNTKS